MPLTYGFQLIGYYQYQPLLTEVTRLIGLIQQGYPPTWLLVITPLLVIIAIPTAYYLFVKNERILKNFILKNHRLYNFLVNKWYFDELYNFIFVEPVKKIGLFFWKKGDINTIDRYGPDGISR